MEVKFSIVSAVRTQLGWTHLKMIMVAAKGGVKGRNVSNENIFWKWADERMRVVVASLKDAGRLTFAVAKIGADIIPGLLDSLRKAKSDRKEYGCKPHKLGASK